MKTFVRVGLINVGLILAAIVAAELIFGNWIFGHDMGVLNLPRNERRTFDVSGLIPGGSTITYTRDGYGFRGPTASPDRISVLVLGGSTTNERYVTDDETWVARLGAKFQNNGAPLEFANASVDGQTSIGHLAAIDRWLTKVPGLKPRHMLIYIGINDTSLTPDQQRQYDDMISPQRARRIRQYVLNKSALYNLFRTVRGTMSARAANLVHGDLRWHAETWVPIEAPADIDALRAQRAADLAAYALRLETLTARIREFGAKPIFVTQRRGDHRMIDGIPHARGTNTPPSSVDAEAKMLGLFNEVTLATCRKFSLTCVDLARGIEFAGGDFYDRIHTTPAGSAKIADFLYDALKDKLSP